MFETEKTMVGLERWAEVHHLFLDRCCRPVRSDVFSLFVALDRRVPRIT